MLRTRTTPLYAHQYDYVIKLNIFLRGKIKQESIFLLIVYLPSTKYLSIILTYTCLYGFPGKEPGVCITLCPPPLRVSYEFHRWGHDHLQPLLTAKVSIISGWLPVLCPQVGGEDVLTSGVHGGAVKLACLMSMVLTFSKSSRLCGFFYRLWLVEAAFCQQMRAMRSLVQHSCYPVYVLYSRAP